MGPSIRSAVKMLWSSRNGTEHAADIECVYVTIVCLISWVAGGQACRV